jgi:hypothetical protein
MSRKLSTIILLIFGPAILVLSVPYIQGFRIEKRLKEAISEANGALSPVISVQIAQYRRGWFSSQLDANVLLKVATKKETFSAAFQVVHGPWAISEIIRGKGPFGFIQTLIRGQMWPTVSGDSEALGEKPAVVPVTIDVRVDMGSRAKGNIVFSAFDRPDRFLGWQKGTLAFSTEKDFQRNTAEFKAWGGVFRDHEKNETYIIPFLTATVLPNAAGQTFDIKCNSVVFRSERWRFDLSEPSAQITIKARANVTATFALKNAIARYKDYIGVPWSGQLSGLALGANVSFKNDKATLKSHYHVERAIVSEADYGPVKATFNRLAQGPGAPANLRQLWQLFFPPSDNRRSPDATTNRQTARIPRIEVRSDATIQVGTATRLTRLETKSVQIKQKVADYYTNYAEEDLDKGFVRLDIDDSFANPFLTEIARLSAARTGYFQEDIDSDPSKAVADLLRELLSSRLIVKESDRYQTTIGWREGIFRTNGKQITIWNMVKLLAIRQIISNPQFSLRFENIESAGGLTETQFRSALKPVAKQLADCIWRQRAKTRPRPVRGQIKISSAVDKKGKALLTEVTFSADADPTTKGCIQKTIEANSAYPAASKPSHTSFVMRYEVGTN